MERPELVQNHLLLSIIHQIAYCYLFPDCGYTFPWDGICFLKGGFGDWLSSMNSRRYHVTMVLLPNCQTHKVLSKWPYQPTFPSPPLPLPPPSPSPSAIADISGYPWKFLFQQYFCEQIFACPPVHRKCIKEASQLECGLSLNRCYEYCFAGFAQQ